jgi:L-threonylcarbamoyladenylate synthase
METRLLDVRDSESYWGHLQEAAEALRKGEIVAFPTETVYGLGVNAEDEKAVKNLYAVKQRPQEKEFARMIADLGEIKGLLERLEPPVHSLIKRFWPGPLTIVFSGYDDKDIGIRFPDHKVALDLVRLSKVPVLATSANISGSPAAIDTQQVMATMGGKIKVVLDGGPCPLRVPSTVVKVFIRRASSATTRPYEILRIGAIPEEAINECLVTN